MYVCDVRIAYMRAYIHYGLTDIILLNHTDSIQ